MPPKVKPSAPQCDPEDLLTPAQVAKKLGISTVTLAQWRHRDCGPRFIRANARCIRYLPSEVNRWYAEKGQNTKDSA